MPLYYYECSKCDESYRRLLTVAQSKEDLYCTKCDSKLQRMPKPPSSRITQTLDNGAMVKKVERLANITEVMDEWSGKKKGAI